MPSTRFHLLLEQIVKLKIEEATDNIIRGYCQDHAVYREQVGYIRGLKDALILCDQIEEDYSQ
jgi:hypothetical protein